MRVLVLIATGDQRPGVGQAERLLARMGQFNHQLVEAGILLAAEGLRPTAEGIRLRPAGRTPRVADRPLVDDPGRLVGLWLWQVKSLDEAVAWARRFPASGDVQIEIEVRPVIEPADRDRRLDRSASPVRRPGRTRGETTTGRSRSARLDHPGTKETNR